MIITLRVATIVSHSGSRPLIATPPEGATSYHASRGRDHGFTLQDSDHGVTTLRGVAAMGYHTSKIATMVSHTSRSSRWLITTSRRVATMVVTPQRVRPHGLSHLQRGRDHGYHPQGADNGYHTSQRVATMGYNTSEEV
ncbi:hypothetical protein AVEN_169745-1 [Araneus ventricosus]|uniref:Uncharacterized protein n=1 Tax=Araneus ventricosus TaxID=182803 RepID=A0A4Y2N0P0_ARAVE|nr:hypothetical protein AVEN_169745-1 [Araneus ventricosus]